MEQYSEVIQALISYNPKRDIRYILERTKGNNLHIECLKSQTKYKKSLNLHFSPISITSSEEFVVIKGEEQVCVYNTDNETLITLERQGAHVLDIQWHPLSERAIGVLTGDSVLCVYSLPNQFSDFTYGFFPKNPVSFCFFQEKNRSLFRFAAAVLMSNGEVHFLSPVVPKNFILEKDILNLPSIFTISNNSYIRHEERLLDWMMFLESHINPDSKNWNRLFVENYSYIQPVSRGPYFASKETCSEIRVVSSANPCVLLLKSIQSLKIFVGAGDLVPSFSEGKPSVNFELYEDINIRGQGMLEVGETIIYYVDNILYRIDLPWLPILKKSYDSLTDIKTLPTSIVTTLRSDVRIFSMTFQFRNIERYLIYSLERGLQHENLKINPKKDAYLKINEASLNVNIADVPELPVRSLDSLKRAMYEIPPYESEEAEVMNLLKAFDEFVNGKIIPLSERLSEVNRIMDSCQVKEKELEKNYQIIENKIIELENTNTQLGKKIEMIRDNDITIRRRIQEIVEIQQNAKRPLTDAEKSLSAKLSQLENISKKIKNSAAEKVKELFDCQDSLKSLSLPELKNDLVQSELLSISYQLQDVSFQINKFNPNSSS
ncbi:hypothetical protein SteCoe_3899 [Stentor coeruleus]|uniref:Uncharacterized protein n=1 Tax=Stentor coeruleus TaxID=5963 RepID=A0A1R2CW17_9CILI|nr:hypothetical protein SteCoe_3899 [Stentor coeruleus]